MSNHFHRRRLRFERLDARLTLTGEGLGAESFGDWHNESNAQDVNGDGRVSPLDAGIAVNLLIRHGSGSVTDVQAQWEAVDAGAAELYGGYHPDVSLDGRISGLDVLRVINRLEDLKDAEHAPIEVMPDQQGRPLRIVYRADDGRTKEVDVAQRDLTIEWIDDDVYATNEESIVVIIASPGEGVLEAEFTAEDGMAMVTRLEVDGTEIIETYVCMPGFQIENGVTFEVIAPDEIRLPIEGFGGALGALVTRQINYPDGAQATYEFEEATLPNLLSVSVQLSTGEQVDVDVQDETIGTESIVYARSASNEPIVVVGVDGFEADLFRLLGSGFESTETLTPADIYAALQDHNLPPA